MTTNEAELSFESFINDYCDNVREGFTNRWSQVRPEIYEKHIHECIGGLLSRQATLSIEFASAPSTWNGHVAPLFLRCQTDAYITFAWILEKPEERTKMYTLYGLGQEKLFIEYLEEALRDDPEGYDADTIQETIETRRTWLEAQLAQWAVEVNVGSWSGMTTRDMAKEIGRESIYRYAYVPFSGAAHNMWQHVGIYNTDPCQNPLHKYHVVPSIRDAPRHPDFMYRSAKYVSETYDLFDKKMAVTVNTPMPVDFFVDHPFLKRGTSDGGADDG